MSFPRWTCNYQNTEATDDVFIGYGAVLHLCTVEARNPTSEELKDEHAPADLPEDLLPDAAPALKAPLADVQHVVAPEDPAEDEVQEGKGQDDGAGGSIGQGYNVDEHHGAHLPAIPHAVGPQGGHLVPV